MGSLNTKKQTGNKGEQIAVNYLQKEGFKIITTNWRYLKAEIDIIAENEDCIVFVEVKTRSTEEFGRPEEFVSMRQQKLIISAAHQFIVSEEIDKEARFDIVAIILSENNTEHIEHLKAAFYPTL